MITDQMGREVDYSRESAEPFDALGTYGPPDAADQAFSRFMAASGGPEYDTAEIPVHRLRPPHLSALDVVWLFLATGLVVAVVFVVSMARSSMNDVGLPAAAGPITLPSTAKSASQTLVIVQISSTSSHSKADASARDLVARGFPAKVLQSDDYRPLNKGFYVVFTGFYADTADGRAEAKRVQSRLPGALIRDVHPR